MPDNVQGYINYFRRLLEEIAAGRTEASTILAMSDEELKTYNETLTVEADAETQRGDDLEKTKGD